MSARELRKCFFCLKVEMQVINSITCGCVINGHPAGCIVFLCFHCGWQSKLTNGHPRSDPGDLQPRISSGTMKTKLGKDTVTV